MPELPSTALSALGSHRHGDVRRASVGTVLFLLAGGISNLVLAPFVRDIATDPVVAAAVILAFTCAAFLGIGALVGGARRGSGARTAGLAALFATVVRWSLSGAPTANALSVLTDLLLLVGLATLGGWLGAGSRPGPPTNPTRSA